MKKIMIMRLLLYTLIALAACSGSGDAPEQLPPQIENNLTTVVSEEIPTDNLPAEELKIQIDAATDELLSTFAHLYYATIRVPRQEEGATLVVWANQTLFNFAVVALASDWLEDTWGFSPNDSFGCVSVLLPGEAFVIEHYVGAGTLPHRGISFTDETGGNTRVFFFQENHAYPEHGGQWIIQEIEADRIIWGFPCGFDTSSEEDYSIVINGVSFAAEPYHNAIGARYSTADVVYTVAGEQFPTHVTMAVLWSLGIDAIQGGSQISLQHDGGSIGVGLSVHNYLAFGADRVTIGIDDTFMADDGYFTQYIPLSLVSNLGFDVHFEGGRVYINGQFNASLTVPHPLATALQNFINNAAGETKALMAHVGGGTDVLAIEFVDGFAEATLFIFTGRAVIYKKIGSIEGFPFSLGFAPDGNLVKTTGDGGNISYTMLGGGTNLSTGQDEIIYTLTIYAERADDGHINYFRFDGGWLEGIEGGRHSITAEEFNIIRDGIGDRVTSWRDFWDETESILTWVTRLPN